MLKLKDVVEAQNQYRATLPEMVDRETVILLIFQAIDNVMEALEEGLERRSLIPIKQAKPTTPEARP